MTNICSKTIYPDKFVNTYITTSNFHVISIKHYMASSCKYDMREAGKGNKTSSFRLKERAK